MSRKRKKPMTLYYYNDKFVIGISRDIMAPIVWIIVMAILLEQATNVTPIVWEVCKWATVMLGPLWIVDNILWSRPRRKG